MEQTPYGSWSIVLYLICIFPSASAAVTVELSVILALCVLHLLHSSLSLNLLFCAIPHSVCSAHS